MTTGHKKDHFTVMLGCTTDGGKLPPYVIFKRKSLLKEKFPPSVIMRVPPNGWMDDDLVNDWLHRVWESRVGGLAWHRSHLVLDVFCCHKTDCTNATL